jgi:hypothetical protein
LSIARVSGLKATESVLKAGLSYRSYRKKMPAINLLSIAGTYSGMGGWGASVAAQFMPGVSIIGYSREIEKEADLEGARLMAASPSEKK